MSPSALPSMPLDGPYDPLGRMSELGESGSELVRLSKFPGLLLFLVVQDMSLSRYLAALYAAVTRGRPVWHLPLHFALGLAPVFIWLVLFKSAGSIPVSWRPAIKVPTVPLLDAALFGPSHLTAWAFWVFVLILSAAIYLNFTPRTQKDCLFSNNTVYDLEVQTEIKNEDSQHKCDNDDVPLVYIVCAALTLAVPLLNILHFLAQFICPTLDILSFISYVIMHLAMPISCSIYLYLVHPPGDMRLFATNMGVTNILALATHILSPSAPPWFIHLYGLDAKADYDTLGYAAGLTRVDSALGTNLSTAGFHKSPIVFGACPSVHSAMAFTCFLWVSITRAHATRNVWVLRIARIITSIYVLVQWWATMYLDHHWRLDLFAGMVYVLAVYICIRCIGLSHERGLGLRWVYELQRNGQTCPKWISCLFQE